VALVRDHPEFVGEPSAVKTRFNVGGNGVGKVTGLPPTLTVAFEGDPNVTYEFPVIGSDSLRPFATRPCHSSVFLGPIL
jgi:hypothetical protein